MIYMNRDISWLSFNQRVSDEMSKEIPLGDKILFQGISFSNLEEFMIVRYPIALNTYTQDENEELTKAIIEHYATLCSRFAKFNTKEKIIRTVHELSKSDCIWIEKKFKRDIFPALQPITIEKSRQYSLRSGFYIMVITQTKDENELISYIEIPKMIDRFITIPSKHFCVPVEDIIQSELKYIFHNMKILDSFPFFINRSAEIYLQSNGYQDPLEMVKMTLHEREQSWITTLEVGATTHRNMKLIKSLIPLSPNSLILASERIKLSDLKKLPKDILDEEEYSRKAKIYNTFPNISLFDYIKESDRLAFHPFESYQASMVRFLEEASKDPNVISIKISLYRVSDNSEIIQSLLRAADHGKLVTVLVELKARFDEHHNIEISRILREGGVRIVYTKPNIKTHAKVCLITRREKKGIRIYAQVGTGNYSESNSKQYTDYSYFTADQNICYDLTRFFNLLSSEQEPFKSKSIVYAPYNMRDTICELIEQEIKKAKKKKKAKIIVKCNSLTDEGIANMLVDAAKAGVHVTMIIRGACIIHPMKNLKIYSIVGQYLEHSRVYIFGTKKNCKILIGSADLMKRNLSLRNELLINIENDVIKDRILNHIDLYIKDNVNRRVILDDYNYQDVIPPKNTKPINCHEAFEKEAKKIALC